MGRVSGESIVTTFMTQTFKSLEAIANLETTNGERCQAKWDILASENLIQSNN